MQPLPRDVRDEELISFVNQWVTFLESEDYERAFLWTDHEPGSPFTTELIRRVIKSYDEADAEQRVTLDGWSYEKGIDQRKKVERWDTPASNGCVGYVWYDLNIDERLSDVTALFNFYLTEDGVIVRLEDIHVM
jgi:hypothetical protein